VVQEYERAVIFRLGRLLKGGAKGPGIFFVVPCLDSYRKVDLRTVSFDVPPQEILSRDSVTVSVDAVVYYRVSDPIMAETNVEDYRIEFNPASFRYEFEERTVVDFVLPQSLSAHQALRNHKWM
ncbi:Mechanosensory protein 2, partial [Halocaridina rubra]